MNASVVGAMLFVLIGVAFLGAAALERWRRGNDPSSWTRRRVAAVADLLVGAVAVADGGVSVIGEPERVVVWSAGSVALVLAVGLLVCRLQREHAGVGRAHSRS